MTDPNDAAVTTSYLEAEIRAQPAVLRTRGKTVEAATRAAAEVLGRPEVDHILLMGRGSSANAASCAQYLFCDELGIPAYRADPDLWAGADPPDPHGAAVVAISQSGRADDLVGAVNAARRRGCPTVALSNDPESPLAAAAEVAVPLAAGPELSIPATKTYTASLHALAGLVAACGADRVQSMLGTLPDLVAECVDRSFRSVPDLVEGLAPVGGRRGSLTVVGRRTGRGTAAEIALKIREVSGWPTESLSVPDLLHGPVAALNESSVVWLVETGAHADGYWQAVRERLRQSGARIVAVGPEVAEDWTLPLPVGLPVWLLDLVAVIPGQVAALLLGEGLGCDVDRPAGLTKVTSAL